MADITPPYIPVDGATFNPDQWNRDIDSTAGAESIYGELNGRLSDANFAAGARIRPEHPKPLETFRWRKDTLPTTLDYHQDLFNPQDVDSDAPVTNVDPFVQVAGCATRLFLPYDASVVIYMVSCFYSVFQMRERKSGNAETRTGPRSQLKVYIDDDPVQYTQRRTPRTYWPVQIGAILASSPAPLARENWLTQHFDIAHVVYPGASDAARALAGIHQVDLRLYVAPTEGVEQFEPPFKPAAANLTYPIKHRVRVGIRSAKILALL